MEITVTMKYAVKQVLRSCCCFFFGLCFLFVLYICLFFLFSFCIHILIHMIAGFLIRRNTGMPSYQMFKIGFMRSVIRMTSDGCMQEDWRVRQKRRSRLRRSPELL